KGNRSGFRLFLILQGSPVEVQAEELDSTRRFLRQFQLFCELAPLWSNFKCLFELVFAKTSNHNFIVYNRGGINKTSNFALNYIANFLLIVFVTQINIDVLVFYAVLA